MQPHPQPARKERLCSPASKARGSLARSLWALWIVRVTGPVSPLVLVVLFQRVKALQ
jgi:hypothetical protein